MTDSGAYSFSDTAETRWVTVGGHRLTIMKATAHTGERNNIG